MYIPSLSSSSLSLYHPIMIIIITPFLRPYILSHYCSTLKVLPIFVFGFSCQQVSAIDSVMLCNDDFLTIIHYQHHHLYHCDHRLNLYHFIITLSSEHILCEERVNKPIPIPHKVIVTIQL